MPGTLDEDKALLDRYLEQIPPGEDRNTLLKLGILLDEMSGHPEWGLSEDFLAESTSDPFLFKIILKYKNRDTLPNPLNMDNLSLENFKSLAFVYPERHLDADTLLPWLNQCRDNRPVLGDEPDWLYNMSLWLSRYSLKKEAAEYQKILLNRHPESVEAGLLRGEHSEWPVPGRFFDPDAPLVVGEALGAEDSSGSVPATEEEYYQIGAFQNRTNARRLQRALEAEGERCIISEDKGIYKLILVSENRARSSQIIEQMGLDWFRIPRLP